MSSKLRKSLRSWEISFHNLDFGKKILKYFMQISYKSMSSKKKISAIVLT